MVIYEWIVLVFLSLGCAILLLTNLTQIRKLFLSLRKKFILIKPILFEKKEGSQDRKSVFQDHHYSSLSPSKTADEDGRYSHALKWALEQDDVFNIALTGPYGAGKTSVIRTFFATNDYKYLNVSLAKFSQTDDSEKNLELEETDGNKTKATNPDGSTAIYKEPVTNPKSLSSSKSSFVDEENHNYSDDKTGFLLEKSILQQILYTEKKQRLPYSRFARVSHFSFLSKVLVVLPSIFFLSLIGAFFFEREWLKNIIKKINDLSILEALGGYVLFGILLIWVGILLVDYLKNLSIDKINLFTGDFKFSESHGASALNIHLDELIYFFEVTDYKIVIFEDLDRFKNTSIFTKLREINTLINNSKQVNHKSWLRKYAQSKSEKLPNSIRFIYAVKDDLFNDSFDRTKFFDFILPIIPHVSRENSSQLLLDKLQNIGQLDGENGERKSWRIFIKDITLYVDDMRLLKNIFNEYLVYRGKLLEGFEMPDPRKLFAFILYKNKFPKDFSRLYHGDALINDAFNAKPEIIKQKLEQIELDIKRLEDEADAIKAEAMGSERELRSMVIGVLVQSESPQNSFYVSVPNHNLTAKQLVESEESFAELLNSQNFTLYKNGNTQLQTKKLNEFFNGNDWRKVYAKRLRALNHLKDGRLSAIAAEIRQFKNFQEELKSSTLSELLQLAPEESHEQLKVLSPLLRQLLKKRYVDENYSNYLNFLHSGELTKADKDFVFSVKESKPLPSNTQLTNVSAVLDELDASDFSSSSVLNYQLLDFLLASIHEGERLNQVYKTLSGNHTKHKGFIDDFLRITVKRDSFIAGLSNTWSEFWLVVCYEHDNKLELTNSLINQLDSNALSNLNVDELLSKYISSEPEVFNTPTIVPEGQFMEIVEKLRLIFSDLTIPLNFYPDALESIIFNRAFEINLTNIKLLGSKLVDKPEFQWPTYYELAQADKNLGDYIRSELVTFIVEYVLRLPDYSETESSIIDFLTNDDLDHESKLGLIKQVNFVLHDIAEVGYALWEEIFFHNKVEPSWENIIRQFNLVGELDEVLIKFLNENIYALSDKKIDFDQIEAIGLTKSLESFFQSIVLCTDIQEDIFEKIIVSKVIPFETLEITKISHQRLEYLINCDLIKLSTENHEGLREKSLSLSVKLVQAYSEHLLGNDFTSLSIVFSEIIELFKSNELNPEQKAKILELHHVLVEEASNEQINEFLEVALNIENLKLSAQSLHALLLVFAVDYENKLKIMTKNISEYSHDEISMLLNDLGLQKITDSYTVGSNTAIKKEKLSDELVSALKVKKYISNGHLRNDKFRLYFFRP